MSDRLKRRQRLIESGGPRDDLSIAANYLYMLSGESPGEYEERIFDAALTLHADHGFNASTFSGRVTSATESDVYAAVTSAVARSERARRVFPVFSAASRG